MGKYISYEWQQYLYEKDKQLTQEWKFGVWGLGFRVSGLELKNFRH